MRLYLLKGCPYCEIVMFVAKLTNQDLEYITYTTYAELKTHEYLQICPNGTAPALVTPEGSITESLAILNYLARLNPSSGLLGESNFQTAMIEQYVGRVSGLRSAVLSIWLR